MKRIKGNAYFYGYNQNVANVCHSNCNISTTSFMCLSPRLYIGHVLYGGCHIYPDLYLYSLLASASVPAFFCIVLCGL